MGRKYPRVHRLLRLISAVQSRRGLRVADLARLCEAHERTVYRDIGTLNASGVPCAFDPLSGGYHVRPGFFMPPVELTFEEAMAIVALLEQVGDRCQVPFLEAAGRAAEKIRSQLPAPLVDALEQLDRNIRIDLARGMADDSPRDVYQTIRTAILRRRIVCCRYEPVKSQRGDPQTEFELRPYALWFCQRAWYVVGRHAGRDELRQLKLNRFTSIRLTDRPFAIPDDFSLRDHFGLAWRMVRGRRRYDVAVCFDPAVADTVSETRWHSTQQEQWNTDGSVTLRFTVDGLDEIVWWLLGYGPAAMVLEPPELIARVKRLAQATAERYQEKKVKPH